MAIVVSVFVLCAFHKAPLILNAYFGGGVGGSGGAYTFLYSALVVLVFLVFPRAPLFIVCCLGCIPHVSQTVAG